MVSTNMTDTDKNISRWLEKHGWVKTKEYPIGNIWHNQELCSDRVVYYDIESIPHELDAFIEIMSCLYDITQCELRAELTLPQHENNVK